MTNVNDSLNGKSQVRWPCTCEKCDPDEQYLSMGLIILNPNGCQHIDGEDQ